MHVLFITGSDMRGASFRHRVHQYIKALEADGIRCTVAHIRDIPLHKTRQLRDYDVAFVQKRLFPVPWILAASVFARKLIFDFDDAIWTSPKMNWSVPTKVQMRLRLRTILSRASCVTVGNSYLAEYAGKYNRNMRVIPTCVDTDYYRPGPSREGETLRIGWIGSRPNLIYLEHLEAVFQRLSANGSISLVVICDREYRSPDLPTEFIPWSLEGELPALQGLDIGVMPLADDEWTRGKCGFKTIQYMACGIPSISSRVGMNKEIVQDGKNGFLAGNDDEWVEKLSLLIGDAGLRKRMGQAGRRTVEDKYGVGVGATLLADAIRSTCL